MTKVSTATSRVKEFRSVIQADKAGGENPLSVI